MRLYLLTFFAEQILIQIGSRKEMCALEQSVYKRLAKLSFLKVFSST